MDWSCWNKMKPMKIWYTQPAERWSQGLPLGNGTIGAVVIGGIERETWKITELTYWSGRPEPTPSYSNGKADLERIRQLLYNGEYERAEALTQQVLQPPKGNFGTNLSLCDVQFEFGHAGDQLVRELQLDSALASVSYRSNGILMTRETFASHPDGIVASRIASERPGGVSFSLALHGHTAEFESKNAGVGRLAFTGHAIETIHSDGTCGVNGCGMVQVVARGGEVTDQEGRIAVANADEVFIYFSVATDFGKSGKEWEKESGLRIERALRIGYDLLKNNHVEDYRRLFRRVEVDFGDSGSSSLPTDERIRLFRAGQQEDPQMFALFFQYGRYLTIAGSRSDSPLPMHLQGIWNDEVVIACRGAAITTSILTRR